MDASLLVGRDVPEDAQIAVTVQRPNKVFANTKSQEGERRVYADGKNFSLVDAKMNLYATVPMPISLDGLVDKMDAQYGFTPPLAEFVLSNPYKEFHRQARTVSYLGQDTIDVGSPNSASVDCHHLLLSGHAVEAELWVGVNDHLIRKLVATFNDRPGNPQIKIEFSDWNLAANVTDGQFTYVPPPGSDENSDENHRRNGCGPGNHRNQIINHHIQLMKFFMNPLQPSGTGSRPGLLLLIVGVACLLISSQACAGRGYYGGRTVAAAGPRGAVVAGPNGAAAVGRNGGVAVAGGYRPPVYHGATVAVAGPRGWPSRDRTARSPSIAPMPRATLMVTSASCRRDIPQFIMAVTTATSSAEFITGRSFMAGPRSMWWSIPDPPTG